jgi:hypothetical protein
MASRAWSALKRLPLVAIILVCTAGYPSFPVKAASGGTCQAAYGLLRTPLPEWLEPAQEDMDLSTANRYDLLSGKLLSTGLVDGSSCPARGLNPDGSPNACGLDVTRDQAISWQNQYDPAILTAARSNDLPPKMIKAVIGVESQFWPAANWIRGEIGLGQMTEFGADLVLTWRPEYYQGICRQAFGNGGCSTGYRFMDISTQRLLRGWVLKEIDATCASCLGGVNIERGELAVGVLAETLNASCSQSARVVSLGTGQTPSSLMPYEDFWRLVLANYHAGAGCTYQAIQRAGIPNSWNSIAANFSVGCSSGAEYIRRIEEQIKP